MEFHYKFVFVSEEQLPEWTFVQSSDCYDMNRGYGFAVSSSLSTKEDMRLSLPGEYVQPSVPTLLVDIPYGNYRVTVCFGDKVKSSETTVLSGIGSQMLDCIQTSPGQFVKQEFAVHVDDGQLKLAFVGVAPCVRSVEIIRDSSIRTLFLVGDSTVTEQPAGKYPYTGWGQGIGQFLTSRIAVANHARSGTSSKSFMSEERHLKVWNRMRPSDYLFIQFAHNDEKEDERGTEPFSSYQQWLREYIHGAMSRGATPVLIAPMHRRFFNEQGHIQNTHGNYIEAMRQLAIEEGVCFFDMATKSKQLFESYGEEGTKEIFLWADPDIYPTLPSGAADNTHFSRQGGKEIARLVAACIQETAVQPLAGFLRDN